MERATPGQRRDRIRGTHRARNAPQRLSSTQHCRIHEAAAPAKAGAAWPEAAHPRGVLRQRYQHAIAPFASVPRRSGARFCDFSRGAELTEPNTSVLSAEHTLHTEN